MFWNNKREVKVQIAKDCTIDLRLDKVETLDSFMKKTAVLESFVKNRTTQKPITGGYKPTVKKMELEPVQAVERATTTTLKAPVKKKKTVRRKKNNAPIDTNLIKRPRNDKCISTSEYLDVIRLGETISISDVVKRLGLRQSHKNLNKAGVALYKMKYAKILIQDEPGSFTRLQ